MCCGNFVIIIADNNIINNYNNWKQNTIKHGLDPDEIANAIEYAYTRPQNVCIREIVIADTRQDA